MTGFQGTISRKNEFCNNMGRKEFNIWNCVLHTIPILLLGTRIETINFKFISNCVYVVKYVLRANMLNKD